MKKRKMILFLAFTFFQLVHLAAEASYIKDLKETAKLCLSTKSRTQCRLALISIETIQRKAVLQKNYSCQTYALALGTELLMAELKNERTKPALLVLSNVEKLCRDL